MEIKILSGKTLLVTGGTRGIGKAISLAASNLGSNLVVTYRDPGKKSRAGELLAEITTSGTSAITELVDITQEADLNFLLDQITADFGRLDGLILNAAGGLEPGKEENYALKINRDAQLALIEKGLPLMPPGSWVIYLTSLWAHYYGKLEPLPGYARVAETKFKAEQDIRALIPELEVKGIKLGVVVGNLIEGTGAFTIFQRKNKGLAAGLAREVEGGKLPTTEEFARACLAFFSHPEWASGHTLYVGGLKDLPA